LALVAIVGCSLGGSQATTFGSGIWKVGVDIEPGTYSSRGGDSCSWKRLNADGSTIDRNPSRGNQTVTIASTDDDFSTDGCGTWNIAPTTGPQAVTFGEGTWIVGVDIAAGTYRSSGSGSEPCLWQRLDGFGGGYATIARGVGYGSQKATIEATDVGLYRR
jgi:hypothetical protein